MKTIITSGLTKNFHRNKVLKGVSFEVDKGTIFGIIGPDGAGKSTLIRTLATLINPDGGKATLLGLDLQKDYRRLRKRIGYMPENFSLYQDLSVEEVKDFARRAAADEFVSKLSEGYDTIIGERGVGLSGGQRQRIALARALAVKPSILVMDDTTSAVDLETEQYIQNQLRSLPFETTKFIIAQRISSMRDADLILVIKDGKIAERGTHEELLANHGYYWQTYALQNDIPTEEAK